MWANMKGEKEIMSVKKLPAKQIRKDGRSWIFRINDYGLDGKRRQYRSKAFATFEEAQLAEIEYLNKYKGIDINQHITFGEAYEKIYEYKTDKLKPYTLKTYRDRIKYLQLFYNVELVDLDERLYNIWRAEMNKTTLGDRCKNDCQKLIKTVLNYAEKHWDFSLRKFYNKLEPFKTPGALKKEMRYYTPEEFFQFISVVDDVRYRAFFKTLYYCGLRRSEARGLEWQHIDLQNRKLSVKQQVINPPKTNANRDWFKCSPKTESSIRTLPLCDDLLEDLIELKKQMAVQKKFNDNWFVFGDKEPISQHQMNYHNKLYPKMAGVKFINLHGFRHSCASVLISGSTPIAVVSAYLGHSDSTETLETYTHMFDKDLNQVPNYFNTIKENISKPKSKDLER